MDEGRAVEPTCSRQAWKRATEILVTAKAVLDQGGQQNDADRMVAEANGYIENAMKAAEVCKLSLKGTSRRGARAQDAHAPTLVPELYTGGRDEIPQGPPRASRAAT